MKFRLSAAALAIAAASASQAQSQSWEFGTFIYVWGASLGGTSATGQDFEMSFSDVVDRLDFALMAALEARRDRLSLLGDLQYLNIAEGRNAAVGPGIPASADARVEGLVFTGTVGYDLMDNGQSRMTGFGGFRSLNVDTTVNIAVAGGSSRVSGRLSNLDAVVGLRGRTELSDRWTLAYYGDVGAGESDLTWQLALGLDYQINNWEISFGYKHMTWDVSNSNGVSALTFTGPFIGAKFRF